MDVTIKNVELSEISIPLKRPFKTALRQCTALQSVLVRVTDSEGRTGYGEAPPTAAITGETLASIHSAIALHIAPAVTGRPLHDMDDTMAALQGSIQGNTSAKAAVDVALYDLFAQSCGLPLYRLLGGRRSSLSTDITISLNTAQEMVADSLAAQREGYGILKVKVGHGGPEDVQRLCAIRKAVGPGMVLRIDANQGWSAREAIRAIRACEDAGVAAELVEQPVPAQDLEGLRQVTRQVSTPILADESVFSVKDALSIIQMGAADYINIKLMKTGGIHGALALCAVAEAHGVQCMMGCMLESRLGVGAAAHLAAARGIITRADLDGPVLCAEDPYTGGVACSGPAITMNETPGLGITHVPGFGPSNA